MVKTPRTRHSKSTREPVTIDLSPDEVSRLEAEAEADVAADADVAAGAPADEAFVSASDGETPAAEPAAEESGEQAPTEPAFGRKDEQPAAAAQPARRTGGALAAGAAGGVIALLVAGGLHVAGLLPGAAPTGPAGPDHGPTIAALDSQLGEIRGRISALEAAGGGDPALAGRVEDSEQRLAALATTVEALRDRLDSLGEQPAGEAPAVVDLAPLESRIAAVESALAALDAAQPPQVDLSGVDESLAALRADIAAAREGQTAAVARLDALEREVAALSGRVDEQAEAPSTALIIAATALKAAIDRGAPFSGELDTFAALAPDAPEIEGLRAHAATGVATRAQLAAEADAAADAMIAAARPIDPEAGIVDRLWASAAGLVQVRPIGMVEGDGVPEIVARLDAAVEAGDYDRAVAEFETLPDAARAAGGAFMQRLAARRDAERLVDAALAAALRA